MMIEGGMQNSGLALGIIAVQFNSDLGMVIIASLWGIWHIVSGLGWPFWWRKQGCSICALKAPPSSTAPAPRPSPPTWACKDGRIVRWAASPPPPAKRMAARRLAHPGFVDIHTHYDGQASWDESFSPSIHHGVTTLVMGNCGVGFAPHVPGARPS
jgi:hypothetical protein